LRVWLARSPLQPGGRAQAGSKRIRLKASIKGVSLQ
jgi:hypothetical protein